MTKFLSNKGLGQPSSGTALPSKEAPHGIWKTSSGQCDFSTVF